MPKKIKVPATIGELLTDKQRVIDAFALLNALAGLEMNLVVPAGSVAFGPGREAILGDPPKLILPIPLKFAAAIPNSTATVASVSAQLNLLLAALRITGQLPP